MTNTQIFSQLENIIRETDPNGYKAANIAAKEGRALYKEREKAQKKAFFSIACKTL